MTDFFFDESKSSNFLKKKLKAFPLAGEVF